jgi:propionyl-CoA carboxylase alpha chain
VIGVNFDPMLAKVISWAPTREVAANMLAAALSGARIHGVATNRDMLVNTLGHPAFLDGDTDTAFIETHGLETLSRPLLSETARSRSLLAAALCLSEATRGGSILPGLPPGWRNMASQPTRKRFRHSDEVHEVAYRFDRAELVAEDHPDLTSFDVSPTVAILGFDGVRHRFDVAVTDEAAAGQTVFVDSWNGSLAAEIVSPFPDTEDDVAPGSLLAPMPGAVIRIAVEVGEVVERGQALLWLEAMKMQHEIVAPCAGTVTEIRSGVGEQVEVGAVLAVVTAEDPDAPSESTASSESNKEQP